MDSVFEEAADALAAGPFLVLTGAGMSVESGIPDFRSGGGLWERFDPMDYATIEAFRAAPARVWEMFREVRRVLDGAAPNPGHQVLAALERIGHVSGIVTQNIDSLHERAGSSRVVAYHGNVDTLHCLWCGARYPRARATESDGVPWCDCGRPLKPSVVLFGERIPLDAQREAERLAREARTVLVIGTSGLVEPAASLPEIARESGARIIEINLAPSALTSGITEIFVPGSASDVLVGLQAALARRGIGRAGVR